MECHVKKLREDAVIPQKAHTTDTGYDLWILDKHKELDNGVVMYSTGLQIQPPWGLYFEIVPRSSIIKPTALVLLILDTEENSLFRFIKLTRTPQILNFQKRLDNWC